MLKIYQTLSKSLKRTIRLVAAFFPSALPQSDLDLDAWLGTTLALAELPNNDSFRRALCSHIMHLGSTVGYKQRLYFVLAIRKDVANQTAFNEIDAVNQREKAARLETQVTPQSSKV